MVLSLPEILKKTNLIRSLSKKIVFTNGCFDIIHAGHVRYLYEAKQLGDVLIVGLNSDASVSLLKGSSRPINTEADRAAVLDALESVDFVVLFSEDTPFDLINAIKPDILVKGGDYKPADIVGADIVSSRGGEIVVIPFLEGRSTSSIIEKIKSSEC